MYIFLGRVGGKSVMTAQQFEDFLNKTQRDPRLNEILHPYANTNKARDVISLNEPNKTLAQKGHLSFGGRGRFLRVLLQKLYLLLFSGFLRYLLSDDNNIVQSSKLDLCYDMDQPLSHYFINSSHNTYLTGHQITGKSSTEMYRQCLLAGCRYVECLLIITRVSQELDN